jgi:hypothetical protein
MAKIRIKDLKMGMVLASHAKDPNGRLLLPAGEKISDKHIRTLMAWGITEVNIEGNEDEALKSKPSAKNTQPFPQQLAEEVGELFRYSNGQHPAIKELIELCKLRKMKSRQETH